MKTSLKTEFAQIFSCCPPKRGAAAPLAPPPRPYASLNETKKDKLFFKRLRNSYLFGREKNNPFPELVEDKPEYLLPTSEVCHA